MSYSFRSVIVLASLIWSQAQAVEVFADALYWRTTEPIDWVLVNNFAVPNQTVIYKTLTFDYAPGFRVGVASGGERSYQFTYTHFHNQTDDAADGNLISALLASVIERPSKLYFFSSGQASLSLNYNMFDLDMRQKCKLTELVNLSPVVGLRAGKINQRLSSQLIGDPVSSDEQVSNQFTGIGPKLGFASEMIFYRCSSYTFSTIADGNVAYLWGHWNIEDNLYNSLGRTLEINRPRRDFGSVAVDARIGVQLDYHKLRLALSYDIQDWFNQFQMYDDATGPHNNDLILQGVTGRIAYHF